jgi:teichuronic acid biosynthesis glycosyltransferase TuaG
MNNDNSPLVSVIITAYNHEKYISDSINSVLNQTFQDFEIIVINDGSSDNTPKIIEEITQKNNQKITFINNINNVRPKFSENQCLKIARGKYIAWNDGDDLWHPKKLEKQMKIFLEDKNNGIHVVYSLGENLNENPARYRKKIEGKDVKEDFFKEMFNSAFFLKISMVVRKEVYDTIGLLNEKYQLCGDYEYMLRMAANGYKFRMVNQSLVYHRIHDNNETINRAKSLINTKIMLTDISETFHEKIIECKIDPSERLAICDLQIAKYYIFTKREEAKILLFNVLRSYPHLFIRHKSFIPYLILCNLPQHLLIRIKKLNIFKKILSDF